MPSLQPLRDVSLGLGWGGPTVLGAPSFFSPHKTPCKHPGGEVICFWGDHFSSREPHPEKSPRAILTPVGAGSTCC